MRNVIALLCVVASLPAMEDYHWAVDDPSRWYDLQASHHLQHGVGGLGVGALVWTGAYVTGADRATRVTAAIGAGVVVGIGFEIYQAEKVGAWVDLVAAAWTVVGAAASALICEAGLHVINIYTTEDSVALGVAWRF